VRRVSYTWVIALLLGCSMSHKSPEPSSPASEEARAPARLAECEAPRERKLDSYWELEVPGRYWVDLRFDSEWVPAEHIPMPHHHATRLALENLADCPALASHQGERVRVTVEILSREIEPVPGRGAWRTTYRARVLSACLPGEV
jgi:hypothetical protein